MRVVRLEVFGFKSFMDRLVLNLSDGVTGVVGPNGCGKSNIVDAIRWVLGETRAKQLRGGVLEDVIFNGTSDLRPLGLAEVSLTIRSRGASLYEDLRETNESLITPEGLELVGDESIEAALAADAEDFVDEESGLRVVDGSLEQEQESSSEEASEEVSDEGESSRPHLRVLGPNDVDEKQQSGEESAEESRAAEEDLSATLLNRFSWLKETSEVQVTRRLYRSGESEFFLNRVPCRLRDIKEFFRAVGLSARSHTIVAQGEVSKIVNAKADERRLFIEDAAGIRGFREKIASSERRLKQTTENLDRVEDIIGEVARQVTSLRRQANKARNRQQLKDELQGSEEQLFVSRKVNLSKECEGLEAQLNQLAQQESSLSAQREKDKALEDQVRGDLLALDVEGDQLRIKIDSHREELARRSESKLQSTAKLQELEAYRKSQESELKNLDEREELLKARGSELRTALEQHRSELENLVSSFEATNQGAAERLAEVEALVADVRKRLQEKKQATQGENESLALLKGKRAVLEGQVEAALSGEEQSAFDRDRFYQLVDLCEVPSDYAAPLQAALRGRSRCLVSKSEQDVYDQCLTDGGLREGLSGVLLLEPNLSSGEVSPSGVDVPRLLDKLSISEQATSLFEAMLGRTYLVDNAEQGLSLFKRGLLGRADSCVTARGEFIDALGIRYAGEDKSDPVSLRKQIEEVAALERTHLERLGELERELEILVSEQSELEQRHSEALDQRNKEQEQLQKLSQERGALQGRMHSQQSSLSQVESDLTGLENSRSVATSRIREIEEQKGSTLDEIRRLSDDGDDEIRVAIRELHESYSAIEEKRGESRHRLSELSDSTRTSSDSLEQVRSQLSNVRLELEKRHLNEESGEYRLRESYGDEYVEALLTRIKSGEFAEAEFGEQNALMENVRRLRARLQREGEVDPDSIERYEEENQRLEYLTGQRDDLTKASKTLKETIERLRKTSEQLFLKNFENIRRNFVELVPRLFGGGRGDIQLQDPTQPLETGIDITVRPPGKKPKSIDLLSGGEKALTATALIIAMFIERPSPLCILDEVDAPLDEANLQRFLAMIGEMSEKTQFLMITHNKASMTACSQLVGVTMEQPGASKVLSVSLNDAIRQVA